MGRKIPARKHHGVRDPIRQAQVRYEQIKDKINNPPAQKSEQKLSYKLTQLARLRDDTKAGKVKKSRLVQHHEDKPRNRNEKKFQPIAPRTDETNAQFMRRVNRITTEGLKEAEYEAKYGVEVIRNQKTGEISVKKRPKDELTELMKAKRQGKKAKDKTKKKPAIDPKVARQLIKQAIKECKEEEKQEKLRIEEYKRDTFKFGEVVQAPPTLTTPRRAQKNETVPRPGKKNNLLLKKMLEGTDGVDQNTSAQDATQESSDSNPKKKKTSTDLKGKRKDLSHAARKMIEQEQSTAVQLYREMKKNKMMAK